MPTSIPRGVRVLAFVAVFAVAMIWLTPSFSSQEALARTKPSMTSTPNSDIPSPIDSNDGGFSSSPSSLDDVNNSTSHSTATSPMNTNKNTTIIPPPTKHSNSSTSINLSSSQKDSKEVIGSKVAVIVETRNLTHLMPLLMHFSSVLGPSWPIVLFTNSTADVSNSASFHAAVNDSRIVIKYIPSGFKLTTSHNVSAFLTTPWFWEQLEPATHVLMFQADSIICANSPQRVEDFLEYDMVGAPIGAKWGYGFNGGLSLRNRTMTLDILKTENWEVEKEEYTRKVKQWKAELRANGSVVPEMDLIPGTLAVDMEDQWFYQKMKARGGRFPNQEVALKFAVETIYAEFPLGYHQVQRYYGQPEKAYEMAFIDRWCPENRLCTDDFIYQHPYGDELDKEDTEEGATLAENPAIDEEEDVETKENPKETETDEASTDDMITEGDHNRVSENESD